MNHTNRSMEDHASSRYTCVSLRLIDELQRDYLAGRDPGASFPHVDATMAAIIVAESLEADRLWDKLPELMTQGAPPDSSRESLSDWSLATLAELFFNLADVASKQDDKDQQRDYRALAWATLEQALNSPTASPMLWYEDIFRDIGEELRFLGEAGAIQIFKRGLAHNLRHNEGGNAHNLLRDLAETYLRLDDLDAGLRIFAALLRNDPSDIWTYNVMAITFDNFGLTEIGAQAACRGLELLDETGDPEELRDQLLRSLGDMEHSERHGREADVDPAVLADVRAALALDFDASARRPIADLCRASVPDLDQVPVKRPREKPDLPPPDVSLRQPGTSAPRRDLGRNDPCWCGSGKKYKHCHMRADRGRA